MAKKLRIIPLGGLGEIGKNMTVLEYGHNMIVVDCGVMFPESDMYGIDLVLPQFDYVVEHQDRLRGIVLTHGHMDHIGGLPYLFRQVQTTVYGTALTIGMVRRQLEEADVLQQARLQVVEDTQVLQLGPFKISLFPVAHSIPGAVGLVIDTPVGAVVHTGDYKLDETPAGGQTTDLERLRRLIPKARWSCWPTAPTPTNRAAPQPRNLWQTNWIACSPLPGMGASSSLPLRRCWRGCKRS